MNFSAHEARATAFSQVLTIACCLVVRLGLIIIIIIIIITTTIFVVLSSRALAICESSLWFLWAEVDQRQVAANSQAKLQT